MRTSPSTAFTDAIEEGRIPQWKIVIAGDTYRSGAIIDNSLSIKSAVSSTSRFEVGCVVIGQLSFTLKDFEHELDADTYKQGDIATVYCGYDGEYVKMGVYYVDTITPTENTLAFNCYDVIAKLDNGNVDFTGITFPAQIRTIVSAIATQAGVSLEDTAFGGGQMYVTEAPTMKMTYRQALAYCLQAIGKYACANSDGEIRIRWFNTNEAIEISKPFSSSVNTGTSYTGVVITVNGTDYTTASDPSRTPCTYRIRNNPFIDENNAMNSLTYVWDAFRNMWFASGTVSVCSNPLLEAGDVINTNTWRDWSMNLPITSLTYKGTLRMSLSCNGAENMAALEDDRPEEKGSGSDVQAQEMAQEAINDINNYKTALGVDGFVFVRLADFDPTYNYGENVLVFVTENTPIS